MSNLIGKPLKKKRRQNVRLSRGDRARLAREVTRAQQRHTTTGGKAVNHALGESGLWRARHQLVPFAWLTGVLLTGLILHHVPHRAAFAPIAGIFAAAALAGFTSHLSLYVRNAMFLAAGLAAVYLPVLALAWGKPAVVSLLVVWLAGSCSWWRKHHWHLAPPETGPEPSRDDYATFNRLAETKRWEGHLGPCEQLPGGGRRYMVQLDGIKTVISNVLSEPERVAGAWHKPMTEAFAERSPDGITSRGYLTILGTDTLAKGRMWDGSGIDPETGMAVIGRYADGSPVHVKFFEPMNGTKHALIAGTTGSGKSELLQTIIFIALKSGIIPVVLDPQEGQSLPFWQDKIPYAKGRDECLAVLRALHTGMMARSRHLAAKAWDDEGIPRKGMGFFDSELTGLPKVLCLFDEAHLVLSEPTKTGDEAVRKTMEIGRLGRKTGLAMWLATHVPSLSDLGGEQALRDMLRGGNVMCLRTANSVAHGMVGLGKDPSVAIAPYFPDGSETTGVGLVVGPDNRPDAPMRTDLVPKSFYRDVPSMPGMDEWFAEPLAVALSGGGVQLDLGDGPRKAPHEQSAEERGRTAVDAVWKVLADDGGDLYNGDLAKRVHALATREWGRPKAFHPNTIIQALDQLEAGFADGRKVVKTMRDRRKYYRAVKPEGNQT